jgi:TIR domain
MPGPVARIRSALNRLREVLFKGLFRARFRYDVFISYSHRDKEYAVNLKTQLGSLDFSCFIDEEESPPGSWLDPTLAKALRRSATLVLLATERALTRPYVTLEFEKFIATKRTIVPINISDALTRNNKEALTRQPWNIIKSRNLVWIDETDDAFAKKNPSPPVADGIEPVRTIR